MDLRIEIDSQRDLLVGTANGGVTYAEAVRVLKAISDVAAKKQLDKILVDCLAVDGDLTTFERYRLGAEISDYLQRLKIHPRVAVLGFPPAVNGFGARVAKNRGTKVEVFSARPEALNWLDGRDAAPPAT